MEMFVAKDIVNMVFTFPKEYKNNSIIFCQTPCAKLPQIYFSTRSWNLGVLFQMCRLPHFLTDRPMVPMKPDREAKKVWDPEVATTLQ